MTVEVYLSHKDDVENNSFDFEIHDLEFIPNVGDRFDFRGWLDQSKISDREWSLAKDAKVYDRCIYKRDDRVHVQLICLTI